MFVDRAIASMPESGAFQILRCEAFTLISGLTQAALLGR